MLQQEAISFIDGKTEQELCDYLATKPIPYNDWKDADHNTLKELTFQNV